MEKIGKNLIFSLDDEYWVTYITMRADNTYLDMIVVTQSYSVNKKI